MVPLRRPHLGTSGGLLGSLCCLLSSLFSLLSSLLSLLSSLFSRLGLVWGLCRPCLGFVWGLCLVCVWGLRASQVSMVLSPGPPLRAERGLKPRKPVLLFSLTLFLNLCLFLLLCLSRSPHRSLSSVVRAMVLSAIGRGFEPHREYVCQWQ